MTRGKLLIGAFVAVFAAGAVPAAAQNGKAGSDTREAGPSSERSGGTAVSRGDAGSGSGPATSPSSTSSAGSSTGASSSPSSPASFGHSSSGSRSEYYAAPSHPSERAERQAARQRGEGDSRERSSGATTSGGRAVPRGGSDSAPGADTSRGAYAAGGNDEAPSRRAVPTYSRPRDGRQQTGTAVERGEAARGIDGVYYGYGSFGYNSLYYRSPYRLYYAPGGYGLGLGYFYDPFWFDPSGYDPYGYGYGYGYGGGGTGYYGGTGRGSYSRGATGSVRLKIKPREAQVYVDGYFVGEVDDFDGVFQRLGIDAGGHRIEVRADGYEPIHFDVLVSPGETVNYKGELKRK